MGVFPNTRAMRDILKKHPIVTMIGGGILAAWNPLWAFISALSTFDFMTTSGGHPGIGTFFMPRGMADGITVVGIGVMVFAFILLSRRADAIRIAAPESATPDFAPSPEVAEQLNRLNLFQLCIIVLLLKYGELTRDGLTHQLAEAGVPIASELGRQQIAATAFDLIDGWTSLIMEKRPGVWGLRDPKSVRALLPDLLAK
jgi:hypothetical protein